MASHSGYSSCTQLSKSSCRIIKEGLVQIINGKHSSKNGYIRAVCGSDEGCSARLEVYQDAKSASIDSKDSEIAFTNVKYVSYTEERRKGIITIGLEGSNNENLSFSANNALKWYKYCGLLLTIPQYTIPEIPKENAALQQAIDEFGNSQKHDAANVWVVRVLDEGVGHKIDLAGLCIVTLSSTISTFNVYDFYNHNHLLAWHRDNIRVSGCIDSLVFLEADITCFGGAGLLWMQHPIPNSTILEKQLNEFLHAGPEEHRINSPVNHVFFGSPMASAYIKTGVDQQPSYEDDMSLVADTSSSRSDTLLSSENSQCSSGYYLDNSCGRFFSSKATQSPLPKVTCKHLTDKIWTESQRSSTDASLIKSLAVVSSPIQTTSSTKISSDKCSHRSVGSLRINPIQKHISSSNDSGKNKKYILPPFIPSTKTSMIPRVSSGRSTSGHCVSHVCDSPVITTHPSTLQDPNSSPNKNVSTATILSYDHELEKIVFKKCSVIISNNLDIVKIFPYLNSQGLLTDVDCETLLSNYITNVQKIYYLLKELPRKGKGFLAKFSYCLHQTEDGTGHGDILRALSTSYKILNKDPAKECRIHGHGTTSSSISSDKCSHRSVSSLKINPMQGDTSFSKDSGKNKKCILPPHPTKYKDEHDTEGSKVDVARKQMFKNVKNHEPCPLLDSDIASKKFKSNGGVMIIENYCVKVTVPSGAIEDHHMVKIQAAASLFGPFDFPNDCRPVSPYIWLGANYTFKKPIKVEFEHHADISNSKDISQLCMLKASCEKCNSHYHKMHEITQDNRYEISDSVCVLFTDHFCSYCLAAKNIQIPDRIVTYHYLPEDYESLDKFRAEVCFCYDLKICKKTTEERFAERRMIKNLGTAIRVSLTKEDKLHLSDPTRVDGWNITHLLTTEMSVSEIDFREFYKSAEDLKDDENRDHYPPRFITELNCYQQSALHVEYMLHVKKDDKIVKNYKFIISRSVSKACCEGYQPTTVSDGSSSVAMAVVPSVSTTSATSTVDTTVIAGCHSTTVSDGSSSVAMAVLPSLGTTCTSSAVDTAVVAAANELDQTALTLSPVSTTTAGNTLNVIVQGNFNMYQPNQPHLGVEQSGGSFNSLECFATDIQELIDVETILSHLITSRLLSPKQQADLSNLHSTDFVKKQELCGILMRINEECVPIFLGCLSKSSHYYPHEQLLDKIRSKFKEATDDVLD